MDRCRITRRNFIKSTTMVGAGLIGFPYILPSSVCGDGVVAPSNKITLGLIGTGNINTHHCRTFLAEKDTHIVAVCDPVKVRRENFRDIINQTYGGNGCADYCDFRELLARDDIDAVCIGTPDHWHAAHAIAAMQAGIDVYVEKPFTLTVAEGRRLVKVASMYSRILQTGLQRRSSGAFRNVCELVRNGRIGRLTHVEVGIIGINKGIQAGQNFPNTPVPEGFDYDMWLGPAQFAPFSPQRIARGNDVCYWYYISDYTAGFITGNGVHFVDIAQWGIGDEVKPLEVNTLSAKIPIDGLVDAAIAWHSEVVYENGVTMNYSSEGNPYPDGIRFIGTEGWIHITGGGTITAEPMDMLKSTIGPNEIHLYSSPGHHRNFLDCIKTRRYAAARAEIGHHATTTCNLAEISARLDSKLKWDPKAERFDNNDTANRFLSRAMRSPWHI